MGMELFIFQKIDYYTVFPDGWSLTVGDEVYGEVRLIDSEL